MNIGRYVHTHAIGISPAASLRDAAKAMRLSRLSCLPVVRGDRVIGVISERDLVKAMAISDYAGEARVAHYTSSCLMASPTDDIPRAVAKMLAAGCIDLPVVDGGVLVGTVSARELLAAEAAVEEVLI